MSKILAAITLSAATVLTTATASAQSTFHLKEADYKQGDWIFETINAYQGGFRPRSDRTQWGHEVGLAYAVSNFWLPKVLLSFDKEEGGRYEVQRLLFENTFMLKPLAENTSGFGLAWFQSIEAALRQQQTNATLFGPIFTAQFGKFSLSTNTFLEKTFGQNREQGMNALLAWQARYEIMDKVKVGVEGYTLIPEIGVDRRTPNTGIVNRIGPVLIFEVDLPGHAAAGGGMKGGSLKHAAKGANGKDEPPHAEIELGVLFGTTDYTANVTGKVNMHVKF